MSEEQNRQITFEYITSHYALIAALPLICGTSHLIGSLLVIGKYHIMLASYQDAFTYGLLSIPFTVFAIVFVFTLHIIDRYGKKSSGFSLEVAGGAAVLISLAYFILVPIFLGQEIDVPGVGASVIAGAVLVYFLLSRYFSYQILLILLVVFIAFFTGLLDGYMKIKYPSYTSRICIGEDCRTASIYAVLTHHMILVRCDGSLETIRVEDVSSIVSPKVIYFQRWEERLKHRTCL